MSSARPSAVAPSTPDHLVALFPCPWASIAQEELAAIHEGHWQEPASFDLKAGRVTFPGEFFEATLLAEAPLETILESVPTSQDALTATEVVMLKQHRSLWRVVVPGGRRLGRRGAKRMSQLMATMIEAGAIAALMPGLVRLHSSRIVRKHTMDLFDPQSVTQLFVGAYRQDEAWMRTRGLTAFELPEVELTTRGGVNAAYFDLMDIATTMLMQMAAFPEGAELQLGHRAMRIEAAPEDRAEDALVPSNGAFGVHRVVAL